MSNLPNDTLTEIFSRVPVDSLVRMKNVCKSWSELIASDDQLNKPVVLFTGPNRSIVQAMNYNEDSNNGPSPLMSVEVDYPFKCSPESKFRILGSCNGLVCVQVMETGGIWIWNPSTKESMMLPHEPIKFPSPEDTEINCTTLYGFGCNRATNDYKLVRVVLFKAVDETEFDAKVEIYNLRTNSWRGLGKLPNWFRFNLVFQQGGLYVNGAVHWIAKVVPFELKDSLSVAFGIVAFDIEDEEFRRVPKPSSISEMYRTELVASGGHLCLLHRPDEDSLEIWEMMEYGVERSWKKSFKITNPIVLGIWNLKPICIVNNGKSILMTKGETKEVFLYDKNAKEAKFLDISDIQKHDWFHAEIYTDNTTVSLKAKKQYLILDLSLAIVVIFLVALFLYVFSGY